MKCSSFGKCGSCVLWEIPYEKQLKLKANKLKEMFREFEMPEIKIIYANDEHFRARAEFRVWHEGDKSYYAMRKRKEDGRGVIPIEECKIVDKVIYDIMNPLINEIEKNENLKGYKEEIVKTFQIPVEVKEFIKMDFHIKKVWILLYLKGEQVLILKL